MKIKLEQFHKENKKLKIGEKSHIKSVSRKEYNNIIDEKCEIIEKFYDNKINEINKMTCENFIINYLNKEDKNKIKNLMNTNLSSKFTLNKISTNISCIDNSKNEDDMDEEINKQIGQIFERGRQGLVKKYIESAPKIKNFFPYEQKKLRKSNEHEKINDIQYGNKEIYDVLTELSNLQGRIKEYEKENREKGAKIGIEMNSENNEIEEYGENENIDDDNEQEEKESEMEIE